MKIDVQKLKSGPETIHIEQSPVFFDLVGSNCQFIGNIKGNVTFTLLGDKVVARGNVSALARIKCIRCLTPVDIPINKTFTIVYVHDERLKGDVSDLNPQDEDGSYFDGFTVLPDRDIRELILLELPDYPLCGESCLGLCPRCGANLNNGPCGCEPLKEGFSPEEKSWKGKVRGIRL